MHSNVLEILGVAADLREILSRLDSLGLVMAGALVDQAASLVDGEASRAPAASKRSLPVEGHFKFLDTMVDQLFPLAAGEKCAHD